MSNRDSSGTSRRKSSRQSSATIQSWLARMTQSSLALILGIVLLPTGIGLLVRTEYRAVMTLRTLTEGPGEIVTIDADKPDPANDGHLVLLVGSLASQSQLTDPEAHVSATAIVLHRKVEMLQWLERIDNLGQNTLNKRAFFYSKAWSDTWVDSGFYKIMDGHINPLMPLQSKVYTAPDARLGAFHVDAGLLAKLPALTPVTIGPDTIDALKSRFVRPISQTDDGLTVSVFPKDPDIGDLKISFTAAGSQDVTILARQSGNELQDYKTKSGSVIELISPGKQTARQFFPNFDDQSQILAWILRLIGTIVVFGAAVLFFMPLPVIGDFLPFMAMIKIIGTTRIAALVTSIVVPITICLTWLPFRPFLSGEVLLVGIVVAAAIIFVWPRRGGRRRSTRGRLN